MKVQTRNTLLLVLAAAIWGTAFAVQSAGGGIGAFTFLAGRCWLAVLFLLGLTLVRRLRAGRPGRNPQQTGTLLQGGLCCGTALFVYFVAQRIGVVVSPSPSRAIFLNALYVIFVPLLGLAAGRRPPRKIWLSVALSAAGMYLLCLQSGLSGLAAGDLIMLGGAVLFAVYILVVNRWSPVTDGVTLSLVTFVVMGCWSTLFMLLLEQPTWAVVQANLGTMLYCGVISSGVAFTLQIVGQKDLNPAVASLAMSLESVFCALFSWAFLQDRLTAAELCGCALMFGAVLLAQLPVEQWLHKRRQDPNV